MALLFADRVKETSTSVGLSSFVLDGPGPGFRSFVDGIGNGNQCFYTIENDIDATFEVGIGTVGGAVLSRDSVLSSSSGGAPINFAAGSKQVFATEAAQFFNNALDETKHDLLDHSGLVGIPPAETFDVGQHALTSHTGLPGVPGPESFPSSAHDVTDHTSPPFSLLREEEHDLLDHAGLTGIPGAEVYDQTAHNADNHIGVSAISPPSQVEAETGTSTVARFWTAERVAQAVAIQGMKVNLSSADGVGATSLDSGALGFTPKFALAWFLDEPHNWFAVIIGTGAGQSANSRTSNNDNFFGNVTTDAVQDADWTCTQFSSAGVIISGANASDVFMLVVGE